MFNRIPKLFPNGKTFWGVDLAAREQQQFDEIWNRQNKPYRTRWGIVEIGKAYKDEKYEHVVCSYIISFPIFLKEELRLTAHAVISRFTDSLHWDMKGSPMESCGGSAKFDETLDRFFQTYLEE